MKPSTVLRRFAEGAAHGVRTADHMPLADDEAKHRPSPS
jgi:hypothetical protein